MYGLRARRRCVKGREIGSSTRRIRYLTVQHLHCLLLFVDTWRVATVTVVRLIIRGLRTRGGRVALLELVSSIDPMVDIYPVPNGPGYGDKCPIPIFIVSPGPTDDGYFFTSRVLHGELAIYRYLVGIIQFCSGCFGNLSRILWRRGWARWWDNSSRRRQQLQGRVL